MTHQNLSLRNVLETVLSGIVILNFATWLEINVLGRDTPQKRKFKRFLKLTYMFTIHTLAFLQALHINPKHESSHKTHVVLCRSLL